MKTSLLKPSEIDLTVFSTLHAAGEIAFSEQSKMVIDQKKDTSIVTNGDLAVSKFLETELLKIFPDFSVYSEENMTLPSSQKIIVIDPIDGTKSYASRGTSWTILVGMVEFGRITQGFVYNPHTQTIFFAHYGQGAATYNLSTKETLPLNSEKTGEIVAFSSTTKAGETEFLENLHIDRLERMSSAGLKIMKVASGEADLYPNFQGQCSIWDLIAPLIILSEAGGKIHFQYPFIIDYTNPKVTGKFVAVGPRFFKLNF